MSSTRSECGMTVVVFAVRQVLEEVWMGIVARWICTGSRSRSTGWIASRVRTAAAG